MIDEIRLIEKVLGNGKKNVSQTEQITRDKYHVSMVSKKKILKGEILTSDCIIYKNPGTGIPKKDESSVLGKKAISNIEEDILINAEMFK